MVNCFAVPYPLHLFTPYLSLLLWDGGRASLQLTALCVHPSSVTPVVKKAFLSITLQWAVLKSNIFRIQAIPSL
jgi:hypothetical protein